MLFSSFSSNVNVNRNGTDQLALLQFKAKITTDPLGVLNSWNDTINLCQWYGVTCGRRHLRVTKLVLNSSQLSGSISPHIGNLSFLRLLNLNNNSFSDEIPSEIGHLRRLETLYLANNSFSGEIPSEIGHLSRLETLHLPRIQLVGKFLEIYLLGCAADIIDPVMLGEIEEGETSTSSTRNQSQSSNIIHKCLNLIIEIGVACSQDFPGGRMSISNVAPKLHFLRKKILKTRIHGEWRHAQNIH
ncbi:LRR_1 domain-containing protein/LRRNT_2 domain-containing protein/LRR_6 domain-containing protein [Cephalotus follicularis]|uniref:LRR_1 domain-containing protein/LRRNT_2 domain-containing protein/LRR_6 domain-containing protein n=1 Tax=Cephalotus follicularis TaxID=3775 RepID=A0A1Q3AU39_CEPFO|nr:LRR_1 domain-containing protein/LRRNT_2 domain-containing protein/LRR_6 domain-containing protein [Cephalotus follicularis]